MARWRRLSLRAALLATVVLGVAVGGNLCTWPAAGVVHSVEGEPVVGEFMVADPYRISFLALGSWGRQGKFNQTNVANLMAQRAKVDRPNFIISTGEARCWDPSRG